MSQTKTRSISPESSRVASETARETCSSFEKCVSENPATALLISGVVGVGAGIALGVMLGRTSEPEPTGWLDSRTAERIGHQLFATMSKLVPESVSSRFNG